MPWSNTPDSRRRDAATYGPEYRRNRKLVLERARGRCTRCGKHARLQVDHITPVSQGGSHELANLRAICEGCHRAKTATEGGGYRQRTAATDPEPTTRTRW